MRGPLLVAEDVTARRRLFRAFGVTWLATRYAWMSPLAWVTLGIAMAFAGRRDADDTPLLLAGVGYGVVLYVANALHSVGHIMSGRLVGTPVEAVIMTSTRDVILYTRPGAVAPPRCRCGRALGGPVANASVGCALIVASHWANTPWITMAGVVNVGVAVWTLTPLPTLDGSVIWASCRMRGAAMLPDRSDEADNG